MIKERLDILLVKKGHFESRERSRRAIMAGLVFVNSEKETKPGTRVLYDSDIYVKADSIPYVSRGGLKLEKGIREFNIKLNGKVCMDVGASTGGFTDCMLQNGAKKVYAIDVGYGQLAWKLRGDNRVICMERTNFRYLKPEDIGEEISFISIDVSFISLDKILPTAKLMLGVQGKVLCLIKPQFEAGREKVGKGGVVKDPEVHIDVIKKILNLAYRLDLYPVGLSYSPVKGPAGNIEYLMYLENQYNRFAVEEKDIYEIVLNSHNELK